MTYDASACARTRATSSGGSVSPTLKSCAPAMIVPVGSQTKARSSASRDFSGMSSSRSPLASRAIVRSRASGSAARTALPRCASVMRSAMPFAIAAATICASSLNRACSRSWESQMERVPMRMIGTIAISIVRLRRVRRMLGVKSEPIDIPRRGTLVGACGELLPFGTADEVEERLDGRLHLRGVARHDDEQRSTDLVGAVDEVLRRWSDAVDGEDIHGRFAYGARARGGHADRRAERADRFERLLELEDLGRVLYVRRLAAEEVGLERPARRGVGFADEDLDLEILAADLLPVRDVAGEDLAHLFLVEVLHRVRGVHDDARARQADAHGAELRRLGRAEGAARESEVDAAAHREVHSGVRARLVDLEDDARVQFGEPFCERAHRGDRATAARRGVAARERIRGRGRGPRASATRTHQREGDSQSEATKSRVHLDQSDEIGKRGYTPIRGNGGRTPVA